MRSPKELLAAYGLHAKKHWGQNFLHDPRVVELIAERAVPAGTALGVEIGAGLGTLTAALARRAKRVVAIERDRELVAVLRSELSLPQVELVEDNALTFDFTQLGEPVTVVGNLPYNISSPLLFRLLEQRRVIDCATVMLQKELAQRFAAPPGSRIYGAPSVLFQRQATIETVLQVGRGAFIPPPKVDSTVIKLTFFGNEPSPPLFEQVVHAAFAQRRKMLKRALSGPFPKPLVQAALAEVGLSGTERAEVLTVEQFDQLALAMAR